MAIHPPVPHFGVDHVLAGRLRFSSCYRPTLVELLKVFHAMEQGWGRSVVDHRSCAHQVVPIVDHIPLDASSRLLPFGDVVQR